MRLGLVIYGSLETLSGGFLYDRNLVEFLRAQGDTVEIISEPWHSYVGCIAQNVDAGFARRLASLNIDALLQDELNHPSLFAINRRLHGRVNYPIISIVHHLRSSEAHPPVLMRLYRAVERRYLQSVDGFIFNSHTTRQAVESLHGGPIDGVVATPGGDRLGEGLTASAVSLRARKAGPLRLLFLGNVIPRKGLHTLMTALGRLNRRDFTLHIVGRSDVDRAYTRRVKEMVLALGLQRSVVWVGRVKEEYLRDEWLRCHLLVVPSQYEGFGIVYLEGLRFGIPSIASTAGAASEIVSDGESGFLVDPGDDAALAKHLQTLIDDRALLERMSLSALKRSAQFLSWAESAERARAYIAETVEKWKKK